MADGQPIRGSIYVYAPNKAAPVFFTVAFAVSAIGHIWQCYQYKAFKLVGLHSLCAVLFTVGYALREYGAFNYMYNTRNLIIFIVSQVFIYVCPPLLELANYRVLGRVFYYVPHFAPLPPGRVVSTFGILMTLVEVLNSLGVSLSANPSSSHTQQQLGNRLTIAALAIQFGLIVIFVSLAAVFHRRCAKANIHAKAVSNLLIIMYMSMLLILIRCIYRLVEHLSNTAVDLDDLKTLKDLGPFLRYEWYFYVFEATLMLINSALWNIWNPGRYLPRSYHVHLAEDGMTELQGEEEESDNQPLLAKAASVLTFGLFGLFFRKKKENRQFQLDRYPVASR